MGTIPEEQLPRELARVLRQELVTLGDEIIAAIASEVTPYARPIEGNFGRGVRLGVEDALHRFLDFVESAETPAASTPVDAAGGGEQSRAPRPDGSRPEGGGAGEAGSGVAAPPGTASGGKVGAWTGGGPLRAGGGRGAGAGAGAGTGAGTGAGAGGAAGAGGGGMSGRMPRLAIGQPPPDWRTGREVYVAFGRTELRSGRTLDGLLAAYRVGARIAWRRLAMVAVEQFDLGPADLVNLAEAIFAYIDEISAASAEGYAHAQAAAAGERERLRERVAELLLSSASEPAAVEDAARAARVPLPERVAAVVAAADAAPAVGLRLGHLVPRTRVGDLLWAFVDDPAGPGRRLSLGRALFGAGAVVGPALPWTEAAVSAERAALARQARESGRLPLPDDPLFTDDHLAALILVRDPALVGDLAARRLAPLDALPEPARGRLASTLLQWLALRGERAKVAAVLHVHPQTVRYRLGQLRGLFGAALDDPVARFELELVLRARHA